MGVLSASLYFPFWTGHLCRPLRVSQDTWTPCLLVVMFALPPVRPKHAFSLAADPRLGRAGAQGALCSCVPCSGRYPCLAVAWV